MIGQCSVFHVETLKRVETVYRRQLQHDPADMVSRLSLAWCLFIQALHKAGQESALTTLGEPGDCCSAPSAENPAREQDAQQLLRDCLRQTIMIMQLSPDTRDQSDVRRLRALVKLSGAEQLLSEAEADATRLLQDVAAEIFRDARPRRTGLKRMPARRNGSV
jgi:hypothetical protein